MSELPAGGTRSRTEGSPAALIEVRNLAKSFGARPLWSDLSFTVERGQVLAVVGPSGAGKSTLLNCIGLLESVDAGQILVGGTDVTTFRAGRARRFRRDVLGYLFQNYALIENTTVQANLDVATGGLLRRRVQRQGYDPILERVGLAGRAREKVFRLSGGEQQRVALARLLVKKPIVVLADEPTASLDAENAEMVIEVLRDMAAHGCAVVLATHNQRVEKACDATLKI
jgi:putative ABC transport system ATP-binding protein